MSIVYDYLKKIHAQKETEKVTPVPSSVKVSSGSLPWVKVLAGILGCLVLGAGFYFFSPHIKKTANLLRPAAEKPRPVQTETPDFGFLLEGIIYNPSKPFAILDGKMFEKGGKIGDFEVAEITPDTVSLKNLKDGTSRTIRL